MSPQPLMNGSLVKDMSRAFSVLGEQAIDIQGEKV